MFGSFALASVALMAMLWNLGQGKNLTQWRDECLLQEEEEEEEKEDEVPTKETDEHTSWDAREFTRTQEAIDLLRRAKRHEHFAGLPPGTLTPNPWRSIYYGPIRQQSHRSISSSGSLSQSLSGSLGKSLSGTVVIPKSCDASRDDNNRTKVH